MGMAASQARFLNLTARRTNIEYHGQQINQQRTELANESANLYNQMLSLQVPVPPNTQDYTKVEYSFNIPGNYDTEAKVTQFAKTTTPGEYTVVFNYTQKELGFPPCTTSQRSDVEGVAPVNNMIPEPVSGATAYLSSGTPKLKIGSSDANITAISESTTNDQELFALAHGYTHVATVSSTKYFLTQAEVSSITATTQSTAEPINCMKTATGNNYDGQNIHTNKGKTVELKLLAGNEKEHKDAFDALCHDEEDGTLTSVYVANVGTEDKPVYQYYRGSEIDEALSTGGDGHALYYTASDIDVFHEDSYTPVTI
ncbi:hypothetical protein IKE67_06965, partial [bacterium]|nr:hypothetical protein [bacterium]